eukprot:CAMPEP_0198151468 /NCGR_PEP_ID=MMETSP1443-20131203/55624_1 /TAXON_ID=186043 /ORGANISM="Entomoneis sp., Strain CCMP2396" /LENGTH=397 /DNA_ID=CAMNT_0043817137 /DNA_START=78 /DNA_END=1271 /DNA_ORIENTATION=+
MKSTCFTAVISTASALLLLSSPSGLFFVAAYNPVCECDERRLEDLFEWSDEVDEYYEKKFEMLKNIDKELEREEASNNYRETAGTDRLERSLPETSNKGRKTAKKSSSTNDDDDEEPCTCLITCPQGNTESIHAINENECCRIQKKAASKSGKKSGGAAVCDDSDARRRKLSINDINFASPVVPVGTEMIQLDSDPPVWVIPNFLSDPEVENLLKLVVKYGDELGHFERCLSKTHERIEEKKCFKMKVDMMITKEDEDFLTDIKKRLDNLWGFETLVNLDFLGVQRTLPGAGPMRYHIDSMEVIGYPTEHLTGTNALYLTDNDPGIIFYNSVTVAPKRGMLLTWLNTDEKGTINMNSAHGAQANPKDGEERIMMNHHFSTSVVMNRLNNQEAGIENQ